MAKGGKVMIGGKRPDLPEPYNKVFPRHTSPHPATLRHGAAQRCSCWHAVQPDLQSLWYCVCAVRGLILFHAPLWMHALSEGRASREQKFTAR